MLNTHLYGWMWTPLWDTPFGWPLSCHHGIDPTPLAACQVTLKISLVYLGVHGPFWPLWNETMKGIFLLTLGVGGIFFVNRQKGPVETSTKWHDVVVIGKGRQLWLLFLIGKEHCTSVSKFNRLNVGKCFLSDLKSFHTLKKPWGKHCISLCTLLCGRSTLKDTFGKPIYIFLGFFI